MARPALLLAAALAAAPLPALAQSADAQPAEAAEPAPATEAATPAPQPVLSASAADGLVLAVFKQWTKRTDPKLVRIGRSSDETLPEVEVPAKDAWSDDQGLRVALAKIAYKRRF